MTKRALKSSLDELRKELASARSLDADTRTELAELADTIEQVLEDAGKDHASARELVEDATLRFEAEHPRFSRILGELTDALAKLGI